MYVNVIDSKSAGVRPSVNYAHDHRRRQSRIYIGYTWHHLASTCSRERGPCCVGTRGRKERLQIRNQLVEASFYCPTKNKVDCQLRNLARLHTSQFFRPVYVLNSPIRAFLISKIFSGVIHSASVLISGRDREEEGEKKR